MDNSMNLCRNSVTSKITFFFLYTVLIATILLIAFAIIVLSWDSLVGENAAAQLLIQVTTCLVLASLLTFIVHYLVLSRKMETRRYRFDASGIWISTRELRFLNWEQIRDVAIIKFAKSASGDNFQTVICIWIAAPLQDDIYKLETSYYYGLKNLNRFVLIDYDSSVFGILSSYYPGHIKDYRN